MAPGASSTTARLALFPTITRAWTVSPQTSMAGTLVMSRKLEAALGSAVMSKAYVGEPSSERRHRRYPSWREDLAPDGPPIHPRPAGSVARSSMERPPGDRARDARDGASPARPARDHGPCSGPDAREPRHRLPARRLGAPDLRAAQVLRLGWVARRPPDGRVAVLAQPHAARARDGPLARGRARASRDDRRDAQRAP